MGVVYQNDAHLPVVTRTKYSQCRLTISAVIKDWKANLALKAAINMKAILSANKGKSIISLQSQPVSQESQQDQYQAFEQVILILKFWLPGSTKVR